MSDPTADAIRAQIREGYRLIREAAASRTGSPPPFSAPPPQVNRIEIIDQAGRIFVAHETLSDVRLVYQDGGRTLKVFCQRRERAAITPTPPVPDTPQAVGDDLRGDGAGISEWIVGGLDG